MNFQRTKLYIRYITFRPAFIGRLRERLPPSPEASARHLTLAFGLRKRRRMVGPDGLEPSTPRLSSACSNQLSYEPKRFLGGHGILAPDWWSRRDSNSRPPACKAGALPTELRPHSWPRKWIYKERAEKNLLCAINWNPETFVSFDHRLGGFPRFAVSLERR
jgi:hypothetical protein